MPEITNQSTSDALKNKQLGRKIYAMTTNLRVFSSFLFLFAFTIFLCPRVESLVSMRTCEEIGVKEE